MNKYIRAFRLTLVAAITLLLAACADQMWKGIKVDGVRSVTLINVEGKGIRTWVPIPGTVFVNQERRSVEFIDSETNLKKELSGVSFEIGG